MREARDVKERLYNSRNNSQIENKGVVILNSNKYFPNLSEKLP